MQPFRAVVPAGKITGRSPALIQISWYFFLMSSQISPSEGSTETHMDSLIGFGTKQIAVSVSPTWTQILGYLTIDTLIRRPC